ncbi:arylesterase [Dokdonia sp. Asnod1-B02]|uniref:arylesterase n=1 Tax=Dokdonia sp. Asnod1-B02 TaxID=3160573 RepID=UPI00386A5438
MFSIKLTQWSLKSPQSLQYIITKFILVIMTISLASCNSNTATKEQVVQEPTIAVSQEEVHDSNKTLLFFGDSITAGYGLDDTNDAYPALIQNKIDSSNLDYEVINSGLSGETSAGGRSRIDWILNQPIDVFVLELGANDGLRGVAVEETRENLQAIIDAVRAKSPSTTIVLAGMQLPPNFGEVYTSNFKNMFLELATSNDISLIPFILKDVGGIKALNQNDGIHPTEEGHEIVAETVWETLEELLTKKQ